MKPAPRSARSGGRFISQVQFDGVCVNAAGVGFAVGDGLAVSGALVILRGTLSGGVSVATGEGDTLGLGLVIGAAVLTSGSGSSVSRMPGDFVLRLLPMDSTTTSSSSSVLRSTP